MLTEAKCCEHFIPLQCLKTEYFILTHFMYFIAYFDAILFWVFGILFGNAFILLVFDCKKQLFHKMTVSNLNVEGFFGLNTGLLRFIINIFILLEPNISVKELKC